MKSKPKYIVVYISGVASRIAIETAPNYSVGVIEPFFPSSEELDKWDTWQHKAWIKKNNQLLEDICHFLNVRE